MKRSLLTALAAGSVIPVYLLVRRYRRDLNAARTRLSAVDRHVVWTPWGLVWVYDRTGSLLVAMLMHFSFTVGTLTLQPLDVAGMRGLTYNLVLTAALWLFIAALAMANGRQLSRLPLRPRVV